MGTGPHRRKGPRSVTHHWSTKSVSDALVQDLCTPINVTSRQMILGCNQYGLPYTGSLFLDLPSYTSGVYIALFETCRSSIADL